MESARFYLVSGGVLILISLFLATRPRASVLWRVGAATHVGAGVILCLAGLRASSTASADLSAFAFVWIVGTLLLVSERVLGAWRKSGGQRTPM